MIAKQALIKNTGARGLRAIVVRLFLDLLWALITQNSGTRAA